MVADELEGGKCFLISNLGLQIVIISLTFVCACSFFFFLWQECILVLDTILLLAEVIHNA